MKSIMKKIAMMGMLSCMVSLNLYTSGSTLQSQVQLQIDSLSKTFATIPHDPGLNTEYKALTAAITDLLDPLKAGGTIDHSKKNSVGHQLDTFTMHLEHDATFQAYANANPDKIRDLQDKINELINTLYSASLQLQIDSLSKTFATIPHDPGLNTEYKALTAAITDLLDPLKTGGTIDHSKKNSVRHQLNTFAMHLEHDATFLAYANANPDKIRDLQNQLSTIAHELMDKQMKNSDELKDDRMPAPMPAPAHEDTPIQISVIGNYGILKQECGMGNGHYCIQWTKPDKSGTEVPMPLTPVTKNSGNNNTYTLLSNNIYTQYFLADTSGKPVGAGQVSTAFKNKKNWDGAKNIIS